MKAFLTLLNKDFSYFLEHLARSIIIYDNIELLILIDNNNEVLAGNSGLLRGLRDAIWKKQELVQLQWNGSIVYIFSTLAPGM